MKPSKAQKNVLLLMKHGWELCKSSTMSGRSWLQENGCGKGGKTQEVNGNTFFALSKRGWIGCSKRSFPTSCYAITGRGLNVLTPTHNKEAL